MLLVGLRLGGVYAPNAVPSKIMDTEQLKHVGCVPHKNVRGDQILLAAKVRSLDDSEPNLHARHVQLDINRSRLLTGTLHGDRSTYLSAHSRPLSG